MKYIRTKDGIYIRCQLKGYEDYWCINGNTNITKENDLKIINRADTIEELCDCLVQVPNIFHDVKLERLIKAFENSYGKLGLKMVDVKPTYGAIWITGENGEPILKSVAKLNDKGECCMQL